MARVRVLGIDLAAQPRKTCACVLETAAGDVLRAVLHERCEDGRLLGLAAGCRKVAIDAPFGWPNEFVAALNAHRAAETWPAPDDGDPDAFRASLSFRLTDRVVMHTRRPLSVSTDKLGVTAMRCAHLLHRWSAQEPIDRTGAGRFVEVYPAGALARWELDPSRYKGSDLEPLGRLVDHIRGALPALELDEAADALCRRSDDAFDALVAALVARAADLGLTEGPPASAREQAEAEGWIHLPARGSLRFLARDRRGLDANPTAALAGRLRETGVEVDDAGYVTRLEDVLVDSVRGGPMRFAIETDLAGKGGSELRPRNGRAKFLAAHSSAALAANTFGPFRLEPVDLPLGDAVFRGNGSLEATCRTGLRGTPPTLDFLVDGLRILAVESKCTETFAVKRAKFEDSYERVRDRMHRRWRAEYDRLREDPTRYRHLDAAQLVKHYLGLRTTYPDRPATLLYLYWAPSNTADLAPCAIHAAEVAEFAASVGDPKVTFLPMSCVELWADWSSEPRPPWLREHAAALQRRYAVSVRE